METDEEIKKIEEILDITSQEGGKKPAPIRRLELKDVTIDDFSKFLPYLSRLTTLYLTNCIIPSFSDLLKLEHCHYFYLDHVTFRNYDSTVIRDFPGEIRFSNMSFDASCLRGLHTSVDKVVKELTIINCHIDNIQELSNIEDLYSLSLHKITFTYKPKKIKQGSIRSIHISDSRFDDVSFIPFDQSVSDISFNNCWIGSIAGLLGFKKLEEIGIDTDTTVEDTEEHENPFNKKISCHFATGEKPFSLKNVLSLKNYINQLHFTGFKEKTIDNLGKFEKVDRLLFDESRFYADAFLPIARQIRRVEMSNSVIKKHTYFKHFPNLTSFEFRCHEDNHIQSRNFSRLLPLKDQLKELDFYESLESPAAYPVGQFTALETLKMGAEVSVETAESVLTLKKLKKLELNVEKTKQTFDIGSLKKLEFLIFNSRVGFTGFEHLKRLKSLEIVNESKFDITTFPKMKSLKRLNFYGHNGKIKGLNLFPNLEFLQIHAAGRLELKTMKKLKVLDLQSSKMKDFSSFEILPALEKLDLSNLQDKMNLRGVSKFPNLKWLTLLESYEIDDISGLEPLKKLERLDLYRTKVTDVRVLNTLPNLKEVNITVENYGELNLESQLDRPEIAIYSGLPLRNLWIWEKDEFGI
ncbi:hypothetical protein [Chryseobacterium sp. 2987]|uniref:leucine-rich repeat domain-containing protein n=1 Tax=Chryseobacterium sp. 2987 TaxID=2817767 RepID=UPI00286719DE|nr:hypothetical protein [Chryseobacterium sp. 2987]MDR6920179.1 Leucine-rich repeat (LRR) protein [Chryseobacterium sp. 2987]